jgi:hypothetical protein
MRILRGIAGLASVGIATLGFAGTAISAASAAPPTVNPVVGHVYVNDNTTGVNTIGAFDRHADGSLAPNAGSPYVAGGAGTGGGLGSQGALQQTPDGRFLLAVDAGSNQISVLRIQPSGALNEVGSPVSSGGVKPVSIAVTGHFLGDLVFVANAGVGGENYTGFDLDLLGHLRAIPNSTYSLPDNAQPADVLFNAAGTHLAGTRVGNSNLLPGLVDSFDVGFDGRLTAAPGSPFLTTRIGPIGAEFRPTNGNQLFVSNAHDGPGNGSVSAFTVGRDATLTTIGSGPVPDLQTAPCWVEISRDGRFLFAINTAVPSISSYSIAADGALTLLGSTALSATAERGPIDPRLSPDGRTLFVVDGGAKAVSSFAVNGGKLTALPSSPTAAPVGSSPVGIVVD